MIVTQKSKQNSNVGADASCPQ